MDTDIDVFIESGEPPAPGTFVGVRLLFEQQEERFSRFRPSSLLSRLNAGETVDDAWLARAITMAIDAHELTDGYFNPMVLSALRQAGYDRTFAEVEGGLVAGSRIPDPRRVLRVSGTAVELLAGQVDLGGIVKGWTTDLAAESLGTDYPNVFVNSGGDIRCRGTDGSGDGWAMDISAPDGSKAWEGRLRGAIATSTTLKRRWKTADGAEAHHLIDPGTGMPADSKYVQVSARAADCWLAEVWAKAVLIGGEKAMKRAERVGVSVLTFESGGARELAGNW